MHLIGWKYERFWTHPHLPWKYEKFWTPQRVCLRWLTKCTISMWASFNVSALTTWKTTDMQRQRLGKIFTGPTYKLLLRFIVISYVYRFFIPNKVTYIYKVMSYSVDFKAINWVTQCLEIFTGLVGIVNATVHKTKPIFHRSRAWQIFQIFNIGGNGLQVAVMY